MNGSPEKSHRTPQNSLSHSPCSIPQLETERAPPQPAMSLEWGHTLRGQCGSSSNKEARAHHLCSRFALSEQLFHPVPVHPKSRGGKIPRGNPPSTAGSFSNTPSHPGSMHYGCWDPDAFCPSLCSRPRPWRDFVFLL